MAMRFFSCIVLLCFLVWGCDSTKKNECVFTPDTKDIKLSVHIEQFQDTLAALSTKEELVDFFTRQPLLRDYVFRRTEYPDDSVYINQIFQRLSNAYMDTLLGETK